MAEPSLLFVQLPQVVSPLGRRVVPRGIGPRQDVVRVQGIHPTADRATLPLASTELLETAQLGISSRESSVSAASQQRRRFVFGN